MERFTSILIEHTGGKFPLWLAPDQIAILPISDRFNEHCQGLEKELAAADIRGFIDDRNETIGRKIRDTELKRVPFMLIVGETEAAEGKVAVRIQGEGDQGAMTVADFIDYFRAQL
jgi:threonyl-tRNA synthetase